MSRLFQKFKQDIVGILILAAGLFIGLALYSFNPSDPSFNSTGHNLKVTNYCGYVGSFLADGLFQLFGITAWLVVAGLLRVAYLGFRGEQVSLRNLRVVWASLLILTASALVAVYFPDSKIYQEQIFIGGILGLGLSHALVGVFNHVGVQIVLWTMAAILVVFFSEKTVQELMQGPLDLLSRAKDLPLEKLWAKLFVKEKKSIASKKKKESETLEEESQPKATFILKEKIEEKADDAKEDEKAEKKTPIQLALPPEMQFQPADEEKPLQRRRVVMKARVPQRVENWELPKLSLLEDPPTSRIRIDKDEIRKKAEILKEKLGKFKISGEVVQASPGPVVTMFEFKPEADVKLSEITGLADDLSLALSSESLRIIAPIPGRDVVGIETANSQREAVYLKDMLADEQFWKDEIKLPITLGKQTDGDPKIIDLRKMPHLMVAGTTGSGKSVFVVSTITGLIFKHSPKTLRLILIDPKQVDLAAFDKVPHLAMPIVTDAHQAVAALKWAVREMEKRYKSMSKFGARGLEAFNENVSKLSKEQIEEHEKINAELEQTPGKRGEQYYHAPQPYVVIVIEEFGDLMSVNKAEVEQSVVRLAQKARACGIHLILAMQSPRKEVLTGLIKTNIPGRISFKVASSMDSRIILDDIGADRLLANGDMLFKNPGGSNLIRHHGPFLKDSEISDVAKFWSKQAEPEYDPSAMKALDSSDDVDSEEAGGAGDASEYDERYDEILSWAASQKTVSASAIQTRFQIGYPRAARIIQTFEKEGVVGPANGSKPRQVLVGNYNHI